MMRDVILATNEATRFVSDEEISVKEQHSDWASKDKGMLRCI